MIAARKKQVATLVPGNDITTSRPPAQTSSTSVYSTKSDMGPPKPRVTRPPILEQYREALSSTPNTEQAPQLDTEMRAGYKIAGAAKLAVHQRNKTATKRMPLSEFHELDKRGVTPIYEADTGDSTVRAIRTAASNTIQKQARDNSQYKAMKTARDKYNRLGEMMGDTRENQAMDIGHLYVQEKARGLKKSYQDVVSEMDTRSKLHQSVKDIKIANALKKIKVYDKLIVKRSNAGRPTTRTRDSLGSAASNYTSSNVEDFVAQLTGAKRRKT